MKKIYIVVGFDVFDWENHFILPRAYTDEAEAKQVAKSTTDYCGMNVSCHVETVEVKEDN